MCGQLFGKGQFRNFYLSAIAVATSTLVLNWAAREYKVKLTRTGRSSQVQLTHEISQIAKNVNVHQSRHVLESFNHHNSSQIPGAAFALPAELRLSTISKHEVHSFADTISSVESNHGRRRVRLTTDNEQKKMTSVPQGTQRKEKEIRCDTKGFAVLQTQGSHLHPVQSSNVAVTAGDNGKNASRNKSEAKVDPTRLKKSRRGSSERRLLFWGSGAVLVISLSFFLAKSLRGNQDSQAISASFRSMIYGSLYLSILYSSSNAIIADSNDLVAVWGFGTTASGWLIGSCWPTAGAFAISVRFLSPTWTPAQRVRIFQGALAVLPVTCLLAAIIADPPEINGVKWISPSAQLYLFMSSRLIMGAVHGMSLMMMVMLIKLVPPSNQTSVQSCWVACKTLAMGGGPFLQGVLTYVVTEISVEGRVAIIMYVNAIAWGVMTSFHYWALDETIILQADALCETSGSANHDPPLEAAAEDDEDVNQLEDGVRKHIWIVGVAYGLERAFIICAAEVAVAQFLEQEQNWSNPNIGLALGISVMSTTPVLFVANVLTLRYNLSEIQLVRGCGILIVVGGMLFFAHKFAAAPYLMLIGLALFFGAGYLANGITSSWALRCSIPNTFYSVDNFWLADILIEDGILRLTAPPLARYLISNYGRFLFATLQQISCCIGLGSLWSITSKWPSKAGPNF